MDGRPPLCTVALALALALAPGCDREKSSFEASARTLDPSIHELAAVADELKLADGDQFAAAWVVWEPCGRVRDILDRMKSVPLDVDTAGGKAADRVRTAAAEHAASMKVCEGGTPKPGKSKVLDCSPRCGVAVRSVAKEIAAFADESQKHAVRVERISVQ